MTYLKRTVFSPIILAVFVFGTAYAAQAEETTPPGLSIELSATEEQDGTCLMSFLVKNGHAQNIDSAVFETVLFGDTGQVARMTLLDFEDLPAGRMRVRQFRFDGMNCTGISRILINGAENCTGNGLSDGACFNGLTLTSRVGTELIG